MVNNIIKHVRTVMTPLEKERAAAELLKGFSNKDWNFARIYKEIGEITGKPYHKGQHQVLKRAMFEMLVAKYENE